MKLDSETIRDLAARNLPLAAALRKTLHATPELANLEERTTSAIESALSELGIPFERATCGTGCVAWLGEGETTLLLRADIDALPVEEATGVEFASRNPGHMHACGHDTHAAILVGTAAALKSGELPFSGRLLFLFQPAEEGQGGCRTLVRQGLLKRFKPRRALALHVWPGLDSGCVALSPGPIMAGVNHVTATFTGPGGHGAAPHLTVDTVAAAAHFVVSSQASLARIANPLSPALVTFGSIHGGTAANIIPPQVTVAGTMRWYEEETASLVARTLENCAAATATLYGGEARVEIPEGYPPTVNSHEACEELRPALNAVVGETAVVEAVRTMGAEDMGFILSEVKGCYLHIGAGLTGPGAEPLHSPRFLPEEASLATGMRALLAGVAAFAPAG